MLLSKHHASHLKNFSNTILVQVVFSKQQMPSDVILLWRAVVLDLYLIQACSYMEVTLGLEDYNTQLIRPSLLMDQF